MVVRTTEALAAMLEPTVEELHAESLKSKATRKATVTIRHQLESMIEELKATVLKETGLHAHEIQGSKPTHPT